MGRVGSTMAVVAAAIALVSGCGRYAPARARSAHPPATVRYGGGDDESAVTATTAGASTPASGGVARVEPPAVTASTAPRDFCLGPKRSGPANAETSDDPSGFRLTVVVADRICFGANDDVRIELQIENTTDHPLDYDSNEVIHVFAQPPAGGGPHWTDADCTPRAQGSAVAGPALSLEPHEREVLAVATYPGYPGEYPTDPTRNTYRDQCRVLHGTVAVWGLVRWCPPGTVADRHCDPARARDVISGRPVLIRIG